MIRRFIVTLLSVSLPSAAISGAGVYVNAPAAVVYPRNMGVDNGGRLGVMLEGPFDWKGIQVLKVISVDANSGLKNAVRPGDFIYGVNGFNLHGIEDLNYIVRPSSPGAWVTVYYFDVTRNYTAMQVKVQTVADVVATSTLRTSTTAARSQSFCEEHYIICGVGGLLAVGAVASAMSGGSSSSSSSTGNSNSSTNDSYDYDRANRQRSSESTSSSQPDQPRTYGLYGNCPSPGAGYGC